MSELTVISKVCRLQDDASSLKEVATFSCLGPFLASPRVNWGC